MGKRFVLEEPDVQNSPYTGMGRKHWIDAAKYLLTGVFCHVKDLDAPVLVPRYEEHITYPNENTPEWKKKAEIFEGLARSFFIAAPLLVNEPDVIISGIPLKEYYKKQVLSACTPGEANYVLGYEQLCRMEGRREPLNLYQQTVETCALVICLWVSRSVIWDAYEETEKEKILDFIQGYADKGTVPHNWRLFNMLDLAFLWMNGRKIDEGIMRHHAAAVLNYYSGDGWYRDGNAFDYYSVWAFQLYAPLWCAWYGYEKEPYLAARFEENSNRFMENYPMLFDEDGWVTMWGRSGIYRNAAASGFDGNYFLKNHTARPGLARRICSGALLQFLERDDILYEGAPNLGFYRPFLPMVQPYSCAESPLWMGKAFLCLHLPESHPFWTAPEENGIWEAMEPGVTRETLLPGPGLCLSNHQRNGAMELRSGKVIRPIGDAEGMCCYGKLSYHSRYPWEAFTNTGYEAQMYLLWDEEKEISHMPNALLWHGQRDGVLYRRYFFGYQSNTEMHWMHAIDLADFPVPQGLLRIDRIRLCRGNMKVTLGSYGFPDAGDVKVRSLAEGGARAIVLKGKDSQGREKQMAMTVYGMWEDLCLVPSTDTNADTKESIVIAASFHRKEMYGYEPAVLVSQVITRESFFDFTKEELFPVRDIVYADPEGCGAYGPVQVQMKDGRKITIDYSRMEGNLQI